MKTAEIREYATEDLRTRLGETKEELFSLRFQHATGQLENYGRLGELRREVARLNSIIRERELGITPEPTPEAAAASSRRRASERDDAEETEEGRRKRRGLRRRGAGDDTDATAEAAETEADTEGVSDAEDDGETEDE